MGMRGLLPLVYFLPHNSFCEGTGKKRGNDGGGLGKLGIKGLIFFLFLKWNIFEILIIL